MHTEFIFNMSKHETKRIMNKFDLIGKSGNIYCND